MRTKRVTLRMQLHQENRLVFVASELNLMHAAAEFGTIDWDCSKAVLPKGDLSISTRRRCSILVQVYEYSSQLRVSVHVLICFLLSCVRQVQQKGD